MDEIGKLIKFYFLCFVVFIFICFLQGVVFKKDAAQEQLEQQQTTEKEIAKDNAAKDPAYQVYVNKSYDYVHNELVKQGWEPAAAPAQDIGVRAKELSYAYPEVVDCADTGNAECKFKLKKFDGTYEFIEVITHGENKITVSSIAHVSY